MTTEEKVKLVQSQLEAYNNRDLDAFCACYHPEVEVTALPTGAVQKGMEIFRNNYKGLFEKSPDLLCEIKLRYVMDSETAS